MDRLDAATGEACRWCLCNSYRNLREGDFSEKVECERELKDGFEQHKTGKV